MEDYTARIGKNVYVKTDRLNQLQATAKSLMQLARNRGATFQEIGEATVPPVSRQNVEQLLKGGKVKKTTSKSE